MRGCVSLAIIRAQAAAAVPTSGLPASAAEHEPPISNQAPENVAAWQVFSGAASLKLLEIFLAGAAFRANPRTRQIIEARARIDIAVGIAFGRIVNIPAHHAFILIHGRSPLFVF